MTTASTSSTPSPPATGTATCAGTPSATVTATAGEQPCAQLCPTASPQPWGGPSPCQPPHPTVPRGRLKECLRRVNDTASRVVGQAFFNVIQVPCFEFAYKEECVEPYLYVW